MSCTHLSCTRFLTALGPLLGPLCRALHSGLLASTFLFLIASGVASQAAEQLLFIASPADPPVIYSCVLDTTSGAFGKLQVAADGVQAEFLALHPRLPILYAATLEGTSGSERPPGAVRAYRIDKARGALTLFSQAATRDRGTTHLAVNAQGTAVGVCSYGGRGTCVLPLDGEGALDKFVASYEHAGKSVHATRQEKPHPHGLAFTPQGDVLCVADLGNDHVEVLHWKSPELLERTSYWSAKPGAGPRHVSFHPNGKWLYSINELDSTMATLEYDPQRRTLREVAVVSTLPADFQGENTTSEVVVHPSGRFVFGANRGHDSTVVYEVDEKTGALRTVEHEPTQGNHPRFVGLDPTGRIYLAANLFSGNVVSFHVDQQTGKLAPTGHVLAAPKPMCIAFY